MNTKAETLATVASPWAGKHGVSVIIPAYRCASVLPDCLDSLFLQTLDPFEIIVIDDRSDDDLEPIVAGYPEVIYLRLPKRSGAAIARARGAEIAKGDIFAFIDSDCRAPENWIESIVAALKSDPELGAVGGGYTHVPTKSLSAHLSRLDDQYNNARSAVTPNDVTLAGGNMAVRREIWDRRSKRDEIYLKRIASGEDTILSADLREVSKTYFLADLTVGHIAREGPGYFRRHRNRGFSGMTIALNKLQSNGISSIEFFGGKSLHISTVFLALALVGAVAAAIFPSYWIFLLGTGLVAAIIHVRLSREYFKFVADTNKNVAAEYRIGLAQNILLRIFLIWRTVNWGFGAGRAVWTSIKDIADKYWQLGNSVIHFWLPGRVSKLFFFVTSQCNARCSFCFNLHNVVNWSARKNDELTLDEIEILTGNLGRLPYLTLSGGEPFTRRDLPELIECFYRNAKTRWVTIPTNGALTKAALSSVRSILVKCPDLTLTVQFSMDSLFEAHDESRKIKGGFADLSKTLAGCRVLKKQFRNLRVHIATCYADFNLDRIDEIIDYVRTNFECDQHLLYLIRNDGELFTADTDHLVGDYLDLVKQIDAYELDHVSHTLWGRVVRALQHVVYVDTWKSKIQHQFLRTCKASVKFATLYDNGQVNPCEILEGSPLGNVRDHDLDLNAVLFSRSSREFYREEIVAKKCACEWPCQYPINMLYDPKSYWKLFKNFILPKTTIN